MKPNKQISKKTVHRFTENALMKFRPTSINILHNQTMHEDKSFTDKVKSVFSVIIGDKSNSTLLSPKNPNNRSVIISSNNSKNQSLNKSSSVISLSDNPANKQEESSIPKKRQSQIRRDKSSVIEPVLQQEAGRQLKFLQKVSTDTFLIGNENQVDLITICGVFDGKVDTQLNWSLNIFLKINNLTIDTKKCYIALLTDEEVHIYQYDLKKIKTSPNQIGKCKLLGIPKFFIFLKESLLGVFYTENATILHIEDTRNIRLVFNKKYGTAEDLQLYQIPKPIDSTVNIFFKQASKNSRTFVLWRLQLQFKNTYTYKSLLRIYDIPRALVNKFKIDNYSKQIFMMNFKYQIIAAKDGYIIDSANTNIQDQNSYLIYQGNHLLHVTQYKLEIYSFSILTNSKPNKIQIIPSDSIAITQPQNYNFFNCLEMLNGNFILFFQLKPHCNNKLNDQIDYLLAVTQKLTIQDKINQIFYFQSTDHLQQLAEKNFAVIQQRCDMASKIGLTRRQIYLELWNKSNKKGIESYKFLLDTMDYTTIKFQIEKKLKKSSMLFNEIYKIEQGCFSMLRQDLFSNSNCNEQCIKNYLSSHFLLRKLQFFRDVHLLKHKNLQQNEHKKFTIDIQQYSYLLKIELKSYLLEYFSQFINESKNVLKEIRLFIKSFKFPLRIFYLQFLQDLIKTFKHKLFFILREIPELLPFESEQLLQLRATGTLTPQGATMQGIWGKIDNIQWTKNLHIEQISTIYNKEHIDHITKTVWFKRNLYSLHDLIPLSKQKIIEIAHFNQSDNIFYLFIDKLFIHLSEKQKNLHENQSFITIIQYIQNKYPRLPEHLKGKIFLYHKLFQYFHHEKTPKNNNILSDNNVLPHAGDNEHKDNKFSHNIDSFHAFLKLKDHELFKQLFNYEKIKKGCLLKDIKNIYNTIEDGNSLYNEALLNYFNSDLSSISDLKYILNRLNSQKKQFHKQNQGIYEVLVKGMEMKLRLGSSNDIPIDEVMIYIQNIPLSKNNSILGDLHTMQKINEQGDRFKKAKLDMSIYEIIQNCQAVITILIDYEIKQKQVLSIRDEVQMRTVTYNILAEIQTAKQRIYGAKFADLCFFLYLSKIMEQTELIKFARMLIEDKNLLDFFSVGERLIQNLVLYMYKWKFNQNSRYRQNEEYIQQLLSLLPAENSCRIFIQCQIQLAVTLSSHNYQVQFPLTNFQAISIAEIHQIFSNHPASFFIQLNLQRIHELMKTMQQICISNDPNDPSITSLPQVYEAVIMRLLELNEAKFAIRLTKQLIQYFGKQINYSIVYVLIIFQLVLNQLTETHKRQLIKVAYYNAHNPLALIDLIEEMMHTKFSNEEQQQFISLKIQQAKQKGKCYDLKNCLLQELFVAKVKENEDKYSHKFQELIFLTSQHLNNKREDFSRNIQYNMLYLLLIQNPYAISKYISVKQKTLNLRVLRSYFSYVFKEDIFNDTNILVFCRRMFYIVLESVKTLTSIQYVASLYRDVPFEEDHAIEEFDEIKQGIQARLFKSITAFNNKIKSLKSTKSKLKTQNDKLRKAERVDALLASQLTIKNNQNQVEEYPFNDSDDNYDDNKEQIAELNIKTQKKKRRLDQLFNPSKERQLLEQRNSNNLALYLSNTGYDAENLRKTSPKMLKSAKSFQHVGFKSMTLQKQRKNSDHLRNKKEDELIQIVRTESVVEGDDPSAPVADQNDFMSKSANYFMSSMPNKSDAKSSLEKQQQYNSSHQQSSSPEKQKQSLSDLNSPLKIYGSPPKLSNRQSDVNIEMLDSNDFNQFNFKVNVRQINEDEFTPVNEIVKLFLSDYNDQDANANVLFDCSCLSAEQQKNSEEFPSYLKELITAIYNYNQRQLSLELNLIKSILTQFPVVQYCHQYIEVYERLETYHTKHNKQFKETFQMREMFPISGIFLASKDSKVLFEHLKPHILQYIDQNNLYTISIIIRKSFQDNSLEQQLSYSYICVLVQNYNQETLDIKEANMLKEKIVALLDKIKISTLLVKGDQMVKNVTSQNKKQEIIAFIKEHFIRKGKQNLISQFEKKLSTA